MNNFYIAVDEDGKEYLYGRMPERTHYREKNLWATHQSSCWIMLLPKGTAKSVLGRSLTWADEPVEVKLKVA
jgi:hypothetical protein